MNLIEKHYLFPFYMFWAEMMNKHDYHKQTRGGLNCKFNVTKKQLRQIKMNN